MAKAYRDAIVSLIPPAINRHLARTPQVRNKTGVPGIFPNVQWGKHPAWLAQLTSKHGIKRAWFRIDQYGGEDEARARAIAQREEWLRELPPEFKLSPGLSTETAEKYFGDLLDDSDEPEDEALIAAMIAEARKKLIEINARFDALRPRWLHLGLHLQTSQGQRLMLRVSDLAWKGKKHKVSLSLRRKPLAQGLAEMADNASGFIEELYGASVRDRFMSTHGSVFTVEGFDLERGVSIREIIERPAYAGVHPV
ncbi:AP2 domain-containing protein [Zestomonas carbonaria]|uniref:Uncharacterized protein n=1 Tax=Zestomonas carbonaria TaxID=2762745 RepID=A0A7U7ESJ3_9GAMM|nr:AP2 domain-containing protein [Pseudomonas carbonaria]CAD5110399.1 hypothetical protein PSEWESI4_04722 [Pseudomonas carbonaria]